MSAQRAREIAEGMLEEYHRPQGPDQYLVTCAKMAEALRQIVRELKADEYLP